MCGLCEKSINWNYPHYPVVSDGLVFIKILQGYKCSHMAQDTCKIAFALARKPYRKASVDTVTTHN